MTDTLKILIIGSGKFVRLIHIPKIFATPGARIVGVIEPGSASREAFQQLCREHGQEIPPLYSRLEEFAQDGGKADVGVICTPHKYHCEGILAALDAGLDVLVEKPMVLSQAEALQVINKRDAAGHLVVVAFPGSLSPGLTKAKEILAAGELGDVSGINGMVHQKWKEKTVGTWRQDPEISGGGFLFDTGSHLVNTMVDVAGAPVARLAAFLDNRDTPVEINGAVCGQFANGITFSLISVGDSFSCQGGVQIIGTRGILEIGMWGHYLKIKRLETNEWEDLECPPFGVAWQEFLKVRCGDRPNPCPPEVGLRFAQFMDMVRESADTGRAVSA
jgi:predicted dehydrogenase